jgi:hypothetical protein
MSFKLTGTVILADEGFPLCYFSRSRAVRSKENDFPCPRRHGKAVPPWFLRLFIYFPVLRRLPARLMGLGVRREHVRSLVMKGPGADQL